MRHGAQVRDLDIRATAMPAEAREETGGSELGEAQQAFVRCADTFFVATSYAGSAEDAANPCAAYIGCDVSNRGGPPGFVRVLGPSALKWPDYIGNFFFQTLGALPVPVHDVYLWGMLALLGFQQLHASSSHQRLRGDLPGLSMLCARPDQATSWRTAAWASCSLTSAPATPSTSQASAALCCCTRQY